MGGWRRLTEGKGQETDRTHFNCTKQDRQLGRTQPASAQLSDCFCLVRCFEEEDSLEYLHAVLFCKIKKAFCLTC